MILLQLPCKRWVTETISSTGTQPGHSPKFQDCPGQIGTLGKYALCWGRSERKAGLGGFPKNRFTYAQACCVVFPETGTLHSILNLFHIIPESILWNILRNVLENTWETFCWIYSIKCPFLWTVLEILYNEPLKTPRTHNQPKKR